jgi:hypothetical protein
MRFTPAPFDRLWPFCHGTAPSHDSPTRSGAILAALAKAVSAIWGFFGGSGIHVKNSFRYCSLSSNFPEPDFWPT